MSTVELKK